MAKTTLTLDERLKRVEPWLVGLWRFRELGRKPLWCTTYVVNGNYYDVRGRQTPEHALDATYRDVQQLLKAAAARDARKRK